MFFGEKRAKGIITGKSPTGYTVGEDAFDRPGKPMVRIWLDHLPEGGNPGEDKLTLEVDRDLYERLEVARHGTVVWRGKKLLRFETEEGQGEAPLPDQAVPGRSEPSQEDTAEAPGETTAADQTQTAPPAEPDYAPPAMDCPWCGQAMTLWHLDASRGSLVLERDKPGDAPWSPMEEGDFIPLSGGFFDSGHVLVRVCEHCRRAVIDYGSGQCDYNEQVRKSFLFP